MQDKSEQKQIDCLGICLRNEKKRKRNTESSDPFLSFHFLFTKTFAIQLESFTIENKNVYF